MATCDLCHQRTRNRKRNQRGELLCNDHREQAEQFDSMSTEQWQAALNEYEESGI